jgi:uncharacterized phiE125 gp8 family phage protein
MENNTYYRISKTVADVIELSDMKLYLKVDTDDDDTLITALIKAAVNIAEKKMNCDLLTATYENCRDDIDQDLTLRRGPFYSVDKIEYLHDEVYKSLDDSYFVVPTGGIYGRVYEIEMPESFDDHPEAIKITFKAGFGSSAASIPEDILTGIKAHVAYMYENRGDIIDGDASTLPLPLTSAIIYQGYRIIDASGAY